MPRIDFAEVADISDFAPIPKGDYLCRIVDVEEDYSRSGDEMWRLRLQIDGGEFDGRLLFDNLAFSDKAMPRVKLICASLGMDVSGVIDLEPAMLLEKRAIVSTFQEMYEDDSGKEKVANRIPFDGYGCVPGEGVNTPF